MSAVFAALPMYDWPELRDAVDAEWAGIRRRLRQAGVEAPERLVRRNADMPPVPGGMRDASGAVIAPDPATLPPDGLDLATLWRHPGLIFGQTCWGPMELGLAGQVRVVGQPDYSAYEGGEGELYSSAILMRRTDPSSRSTLPPSVLPDISPARGEIGSVARASSPATLEIGESRAAGSISPPVGKMSGRTEGGNVEREASGVGQGGETRADIPLHLIHGKSLAFNSRDSMSGLIALMRDLTALGEGPGFFSGLLETGAHRASIVAVAEGRADVCAIDCRTWDMAGRFEPRAADLGVVGWTAKRRGLPYISSMALPAYVLPPA